MPCDRGTADAKEIMQPQSLSAAAAAQVSEAVKCGPIRLVIPSRNVGPLPGANATRLLTGADKCIGGCSACTSSVST